jgi:hypothetical protein
VTAGQMIGCTGWNLSHFNLASAIS